jgi:uncharacterized membrane protein YhiD involved in acid resistance
MGVPVLRATVVAAANVEGWAQAGELGLALLLSTLIGSEREVRQKSAVSARTAW